MILLDTNVVSAVMPPRPPRAVLGWLDIQPRGGLYLPSIAIAEIRYGLHILPDGRRRQDLEARFERFVARGFARRVLPFDEAAANLYGELMARRRSLGRPMSSLDGQIAAIARAHQLAVATRNVPDFEDCGLEVVDPFEG
ncbi:MAG: type II toxin-antitoxin system VapC family toxin [bacterium]